MLYLGSPMIFYGDEAGIWGGNDPDCRKPMIWEDKKYDPETYNPDQTRHEADQVAFNKDLFNWYQKFMGLRKTYKSLQLGDYTTVEKNDIQRFYAFSRKYNSEEVLVFINRSEKPVQYKSAILKSGSYKDVFSKKTLKSVTIQSMDLVVLFK